MKRLSNLLSRFRRDERGVFAVLFAVMAIVLIATSGAVVDFTNMQQARTRAQTALDAAALALQSEIDAQTNTELKTSAAKILTEQIDDSTITATVDSVTTDLQQGKLLIQASITVPTAFVQLVGISTISAHLVSEVTRSSSDVEVSVALDVTGSMAGTKITALIGATKQLINDVVKDVQEPTYSKMAIAPYSNALNVGSTYAPKARGEIKMGTAISTVTWATGSTFTIKGITKANPAVVETSTAHGLTADTVIYVYGIKGMTQVKNGIYCVGTVSTTVKFQLKKLSSGTCSSNVNSSSYSTYTANSGKTAKCAIPPACEATITTSADHGFADGEQVHVVSVSGMKSNTLNYSGSNKRFWTVKAKTDTTFIPDGLTVSDFSTAGGSGTGGTASCILYGCNYYSYKAVDGTMNLYRPSNCVVERMTVDDETYTDKNPTDKPVGILYNSSGADCLAFQIQPLTSDKTKLLDLADDLTTNGTTAGQIGLAWAWYMLSPNFLTKDIATVWPTDSIPAEYGKDKLVKAVILMTDGAFNTMYENGVPSADSDGTYIGSNVRSENDSPLGDGIVQALALCEEIKKPANKTMLFTVGFDISSNSTEHQAARAFLSTCASPGEFYLAKTATDLKDAFKKIAQSLSDLRLSL